MASKGVELRTAAGSGPVVGIDLGTTYSAVALCRKGRVEMICSDTGSRTTPSVVGFMGGESYVGEAAKDLPSDSQVFDAKRLIGRPWRDVEASQNRKNWPFVVFEDRGAPRIRLTMDGVKEDFAPEEISGILLCRLKEMAQDFLQEPVSRAVITVPAYFNERQRQATKLAAKIAGLEVMSMINEPTAAAIAYGLDKKSGTSSKKTIFIFDLGGGTFDVSVMTVHGQEFTVLATGGDTHLGGQDFDERLIEFIKEDVRSTHGVTLDSASVQELRKACELAKRKLSSLAEVPLAVFFARHNLGYKKTISRAFFEDLCSDHFKRTIRIASDVLDDSKVGRSAIDEVVLVGGSTRIPKVRSLLQDLFGGKELRNSINPDEAVAYGAAVHAAVLNGDKFFDNLVKLKDVTPLSLGIDVVGGRFSAVIPRNTPIPCEKTKTYYTVYNNQTSAVSKIYQGERPLVKDNHYLNKEFTVTFPPKRANEVSSNVTFSLDCSGLLTVTAVEPITGKSYKVTVSQEEARVSEEDVQKMIENAARLRKTDLEEKKRVEAELRAKGIHV